MLLVGLALRGFRLGQPSLWNDELYSRFYYDLFGPGFLLGPGLAIEPTPPTYYFLLQGWMRLFGTSEAALRSLSVAASMVAIGLVYLLGRTLLPRRAAMIAAWLAALCPLDILFAQEARVYALLLVPFTMALIGLARFLLRPATPDGPLLYAAGALVAAYLHITMVILVAALGIAGAVHIVLCRRPLLSRALVRWFLANLAIGVLVLPELWGMNVLGGARASLAWMPPLSARDLAVVLSSVGTDATVPMRLPGVELGLLLILAIGVSLWSRPLPPVARTVLLVAPAIGIGLMMLASLKQPVLLPRTALWLTVPLCVLLAHGLAARSAARGFLLVATVVAFGSGLLSHFALTDEINKTPWRRVFEPNARDMRQADLIVLGAKATPLATAYYLPGAANVVQWRTGLLSGIEGKLIPEKLGVPAVTEPGIVQAIRQGRHVWLLAQWDDVQGLPALLAEVPPPSRRIDYACGGTEPCLSALVWRRIP